MAQQVRAVVARAKGAPVEVAIIEVPDPGPGEVVVAIQACGVCHTDLHYREGGINDDFPFLLGHEAAGLIESVGPDVTDLVPGDFVILNWRAVCGECRSCKRGRPQYCFATHNATQKMTLDGVELSPALGIGAFAEKTLVAAGQATKVDPRAKPEAAGLLGCGVMAGLGAAMFTGEVGRGDSVAVFGCGGVGDAAIAGARLAGAAKIIAVDLDPRKLELAKTFGATHTVNASEGDPVAAIQELTDGNGADVCIEAVGNPKVFEQAFHARDLAGTLVQVGVPNPEMRIDIPMIDFFGRGGQLRPSWYGDCLPSRDFPMLIDLYLQGRLDLDAFVSETIALDGVEEAFHRMERGEVLRSVVVLVNDHVVTSGIFSLDGEDFEVDNNIWLVGDDAEVIVVDAAHDHEPIVAGVGGRRVVAIVCTHGHNDHVNAAVALADAVDAPIWIHPDDRMLWDVVHPDRFPDAALVDHQIITVGGHSLEVLHTPGHSPGGVCLHDSAAGVVYSGDTLFNGGPGATGRSFSDRDQIEASIRSRLFPLPPDTVVHTGHGDDTTIGAEKALLDGDEA